MQLGDKRIYLREKQCVGTLMKQLKKAAGGCGNKFDISIEGPEKTTSSSGSGLVAKFRQLCCCLSQDGWNVSCGFERRSSQPSG